jgi:glutathione S-transferase
MDLTLIIANKTYSSWSFRPWILMRYFGIAFDEITIPLAQENTRAEILRHTPSGKCPALRDGAIVVWDSLAIIEYLAETFPRIAIWPRLRAARAQARSLAAEMHSGFANLRASLPMNMRRNVKRLELSQEVAADVARIESAFASARAEFGRAGHFLFGDFPMRCLHLWSTGCTFIMSMSRMARAVISRNISGAILICNARSACGIPHDPCPLRRHLQNHPVSMIAAIFIDNMDVDRMRARL